MGKHHALGVGGGSRGVEQRSEVVGGGGRRLELSWPVGENRRQISQPLLIDGVLGHAVRVHEHEPHVQARNRLPRFLSVPRVAEQGRAAAVLQQPGQLVGVQSSIERDHRTSRRNSPEICRHPPRMVIRHDGQPRPAHESVLGDPSSDGFGHAAELVVRATLDLIVALKFQCDVFRPALRAFDKTVVESGHETCGIYTKNLLTAEVTGSLAISRQHLL